MTKIKVAEQCIHLESTLFVNDDIPSSISGHVKDVINNISSLIFFPALLVTNPS